MTLNSSSPAIRCRISAAGRGRVFVLDYYVTTSVQGRSLSHPDRGRKRFPEVLEEVSSISAPALQPQMARAAQLLTAAVTPKLSSTAALSFMQGKQPQSLRARSSQLSHKL